jgi:serine/threonine-protein kinase HipA
MNGIPVGTWVINPQGGNEFTYEREWINSSAGRPLSLSMPLRLEPYKDERVRNYFDNLLPDSESIRKRIQDRFATSSTGAFDLLAEIGLDCVGAIQLLPVGQEPGEIRRIEGTPVSNDEIQRLLDDTISSGRYRHDEEDFRISIAGAQEKTALLKHQGQWMRPHGATPTTHILKLPIRRAGDSGIDMSSSIENEWLCSQLIQAYGINVASSEILNFGNRKVLAVKRFDRKISNDQTWIMRLPQEDFCQATGTSPGKKYENEGGPGIEKIMSILLGSKKPQVDRESFFRTLVIFWMLCAIDGHAKNFSIFIEAGGSFQLTPRYDVLSAYPVLGHGSNMLSPNKFKMAMAVSGAKRHYHWNAILPRHLVETGFRCGLPQEQCTKTIMDIAELTPAVIKEIGKILPGEFPLVVAQPILEGIDYKAKQLVNQLI